VPTERSVTISRTGKAGRSRKKRVNVEKRRNRSCEKRGHSANEKGGGGWLGKRWELSKDAVIKRKGHVPPQIAGGGTVISGIQKKGTVVHMGGVRSC